MKKGSRSFLFLALSVAQSAALPTQALAGGSHGTDVRVRVVVRTGGSHGFRPFRPICPIGIVGPGCVAPVRKSARFAGRVAVGAIRATGRVAFGAARVVGRAAVGAARLTGRLLFGRRCWC